ncbi:hypothetical protein PHJA_001834400 [Phtheirospermum japonicum]|uniref:Uncharacterized protein n=1 Tax=Phtheirospermum japonicum TaxID=374723 RepID=A0A830CM48_9LAMI|nr:hypothetical protein PHJA_001834400 [Phtheirospermum japonicum]
MLREISDGSKIRVLFDDKTMTFKGLDHKGTWYGSVIGILILKHLEPYHERDAKSCYKEWKSDLHDHFKENGGLADPDRGLHLFCDLMEVGDDRLVTVHQGLMQQQKNNSITWKAKSNSGIEMRMVDT